MDLMLGNEAGVAARDVSPLLGTVVADGANSFTVSAAEFRNFRLGMNFDLSTKTTGALTGNRNVVGLNSATNTITYDGADMAATTAMGAYLAGGWEAASLLVQDLYTNINGGKGPRSGLEGPFDTVSQMRTRLQAISATTYSDAQLNTMTYNDLVYALRVNDYPGSI